MSNELRLLMAMCEALDLNVVETHIYPDIRKTDMDYKVTKKPKQKRTKKEIGYSNEFEVIWLARAKTNGDIKEKANIEYLKAIKSSHNAEIYEGVVKYRKYVEATGTACIFKLCNFIKGDLFKSKWEIPKTQTKLKLPFTNEELPAFAKANNLKPPGRTETFTEYRRTLQAQIDLMNS